MTEDGRDPLPYGLALLLLGAGVAAFTFLSIAQDDVTYARAQWTALLSMTLAAPAIVLFGFGRAALHDWWRAFWTAGLLAYLLHFWWAVFGSFHGSFGAVIDRQGAIAFSNFAVTALWSLDVAAAWFLSGRAESRVVVALRFLTWLLVTASFVVAAAVFRAGVPQYLGWALALATTGALALRVSGKAAA